MKKKALLKHFFKKGEHPPIPSLPDRKFTYFYYNVKIPLRSDKTAQICWNFGWEPLIDIIYIHDLYFISVNTAISGDRIYENADLAASIDEFCCYIHDNYPNMKGISISDKLFYRNPGLFITKKFDLTETHVPGSGIIHTKIFDKA